MATIGIYTYTFEESETTRTTLDGTVLPLYNITITNTETNQGVVVNNLTRIYEREEDMKTLFDNAISTLEGVPHCCLNGQVGWVNQ